MLTKHVAGLTFKFNGIYVVSRQNSDDFIHSVLSIILCKMVHQTGTSHHTETTDDESVMETLYTVCQNHNTHQVVKPKVHTLPQTRSFTTGYDWKQKTEE